MVVRLTPLEPPLATITVAQYHVMIHCGALTANDPIELVEGLLVQKMPRNTPHDVSVDLLNELFWKLLPNGLRLRVQSAITLADSEPEPDGAVVLGPAQRYAQNHPGPEDIHIVIEIANSSLEYDRGRKQRIYARAGIAVYWIVNLIDRQVEVYTSPQAALDEPCYASRTDYQEDDSVPVVVRSQEIGRVAVADLLPSGS